MAQILLCQHDGQDPAGRSGFGGHVRDEVVDLPEDFACAIDHRGHRRRARRRDRFAYRRLLKRLTP